MKTDYITSTPTLPPHLVYPRFLVGMDLRPVWISMGGGI